MTYDYFYNDESEQYQFLQMPWFMIKDDQFKNLSSDAKILYSLLLNRTFLSKKNGWLDEQGRVYIIYTVDEIQEDLNCGREKAIKSMKELTKRGLVESIRRGLGKPNLIYVKNFATALKYQSQAGKIPDKEIEPSVKSLKSENQTSESSEIGFQKVGKSNFRRSENQTQVISNLDNTNVNKKESKSKSTSDCTQKKVIHNLKFGNAPETHSDLDSDSDSDFLKHNILNTTNERELPFSHPDSSMEIENSLSKSLEYDYNTFRLKLQHNIDYFFYKEHRNVDIQLIDELLNCMLDVICTGGDYVKIGGELKSRAMVISQYLSLNSSDIDHVIDRYKEQSHKITHLHHYLKTMLYTVKQEASHFYTNAVRVDDMI